MSAALSLIDAAQELLWLHVAVFLRVAPVLAMLPGFGATATPARIKLVLALMLTVIVTPAVMPEIRPEIGPGAAAGIAPTRLLLTETTIGLAIGIGIRLIIMAMQTAGSIAAQATSLAQMLGNAGITPMPAMGQMLVTGALALAMILDLHVHAARMMVLSYRVLPFAEWPDAADLSAWGTAQVAGAFALAFTLAGPFLIVSVLYNLTLGIINRAMPQMMVVLVGAPAITAAGLIMLMLLAPVMLDIWGNALMEFVTNPFGAR